MTEETKAPEVLTVGHLKNIIKDMTDDTHVGVCINQMPVILPIAGIAPGENEHKQPYMLLVVGEKSITEALNVMEVLAASNVTQEVAN